MRDITPDQLISCTEEKRNGKLVLLKNKENVYFLTTSKSVPDESNETWTIFDTTEKDNAEKVFECIVQTFQTFYKYEKVDKELFQAIIDMRNANPTYQPVHLASALGLLKSFKTMKKHWKNTV